MQISNSQSLNIQRMMHHNSLSINGSQEKLTSGVRINQAADDAAGLAISTKLNSQLIGDEQALRNLNDGIAVLQTLDGAADDVVSMLQRMRELSLQAMTGTYSDTNRVQMQEEVTQLAEEIKRVGDTLKFNGQALSELNGAGKLTIHGGADIGDENKIEVPLADFKIIGADFVIDGIAGAFFITTQVEAEATLDRIDVHLDTLSNNRAVWGGDSEQS
ncbi:flagellin FliC [Thiomicrorhabdus sp. zzn3]|uniref:flagellin N-terminal helical domain-containing protein n=1 Tax=Thiomicrorhabdus sp. zzn3 TaxID=3039775 RepID=UPI002436730D|nr:flagellin FliC [Thiomicrorhabdus sp. zzn3]MDG6777738.1 flagellin FliC [Thiomicrorhabdus sp. zzn3]